jgi:large subunit ribosomal protein LP0
MHEIRGALRGKAVVLMGKNTMVRRAVKGFIADSPEYEKLLPHIKGKYHIREELRKNTI